VGGSAQAAAGGAMAGAASSKAAADAHFRAGRYDAAAEAYGGAIRAAEAAADASSLHVLFANR
jgi:hypothetical protein